MKTYTFKYLIVLILISQGILSQTYWTRTNGPYGAYVKGVTVTTNGTIFFAHGNYLNNAGIYRSTNSGSTWTTSFSTGLGGVNCITVNPTNDHVYAGTDSFNGLLISTNNGNSWVTIGSFSANALHCDRNGVLYAANSLNLNRTTNEGTNWNIVLVTPVQIRSISSDSMGNIFAGTNGRGIYYSTNNGLNWQNSIDNNYIINSLCASLGQIYAGTTSQKILKSTNNGTNWFQLNTSFLSVFAMTTNFNGLLIAGTETGTYISSNSGDNWNKTDSTIIDITSITSYQQSIYLGCQYGLYRSTSSGANWTNIAWNYSEAGSITCTPNGSLFAHTLGVNTGYVWKSTNLGNSWIVSTRQQFVNIIRSNNQGYIYVGTNNGVLCTVNNGDSWQNIGLAGSNIKGFAFGPLNLVICYMQNAIYKTTNNGSNWINITPSVNTSPIASVAFDLNNNIMYAGSDRYSSEPSRLWRSTDYGNNWSIIHSDPDEPFNEIAVNSLGHLFMIKYNFYRSTNGGLNWSDLQFPIGTYAGINFVPQNHFYFITCSPWRSTNNGNSFEQLNGGMAPCGYSLCYDPYSGYLFASANGFGVYRSTFNYTSLTNSSTDIPNIFSLFQNFPNPFNPTTKIRFDIPVSSNNKGLQPLVQVKVYDILGREVATLVNEQLKPGTYEVDWPAPTGDGSNYSSGVYFYKLVAGDFVETKKMVLIK
jgi:photosystem II stability/assembly factor-like uncharacterized protein